MTLTSDSAEQRLSTIERICGTARGAIFESSNVGYDENLVVLESVLDPMLDQPDVMLVLLADPSAEVRATACDAVGAFALIAWSDSNIVDDDRAMKLRALVVRAIPALHAATSDGDAAVRELAVISIGELPRVGTDHDVRDDAPLLEHDDHEIAIVRRALRDPIAAVRAQAIRTLVRRIGHDVEADLAPLVDDTEIVVEDQLIEALGRVGSPLALPVIERRLRADPCGYVRSYTDDGSETGRALIDWLCSYELAPDRARELLLPIAGADVIDEYRRSDAVQGLVAYVDASCRDVLARLVPAGNLASEYALIALARLGADAPSDAVTYWLRPERTTTPEVDKDRLDRVVGVAGLALAVLGRTDHLDLLLRRLDRRVNTLGTLRILAMFDDPRIHDAVAPLLGSGATNALKCYACLALGAGGNPAALSQIGEAAKGRDPKVRLHAQLGLALIDAGAVTADPDAWPEHVVTNEIEFLILASSVRLLGRRLAGRDLPVPQNARPLVASALRWLDALDAGDSLRCHRGRGGFSGVGFSWGFALRDVVDEARRLLRTLA